jgi:hypothetical protein
MANTIVQVRPTNGVSFGVTHVVTSADQSAGAILFDFTAIPITPGVVGTFPYNIVAVFDVLSSANAKISSAGAVVTYPTDGQVKIANGGSFTYAAGQIINLIVQHTLVA